MKDLKNDTISFFESIKTAANFFGKSEKYISTIIHQPHHAITDNRYVIKLARDKIKEWPSYSYSDILSNPKLYSSNGAVELYNVLYDKIYVFSSLKDCSKFTGLSISAISTWCNRSPFLTTSGYMVRKKGINIPFGIVHDFVFEYSSLKNRMFLGTYNKKTNHVDFFFTMNSFSRSVGIPIKNVTSIWYSYNTVGCWKEYMFYNYIDFLSEHGSSVLTNDLIRSKVLLASNC